MKYKFGKHVRRADPRRLQFKDYFAKLPPIPAAIDWTPKVPDFLMLGNDLAGDCAWAGAAHVDMVWTSQAGTEYIPTEAEVIGLYTKYTGYNPNDPNTDNGTNLLDLLNVWRQQGLFGDKILAYVEVDMQNLDHVRAAIALFGAVYGGIKCPDNLIDTFDNCQPWADITQDPARITDGHCVPWFAYTPDTFTCATWGKRQVATLPWFKTYSDEGYALVSPKWIAANGQAPSGFNLQQLMQDIPLIR